MSLPENQHFSFPSFLGFYCVTPPRQLPLSIPPANRLFENDTYQSAIQSLQQGDRVTLQNLINRDPLIARKVLIKLLRQPDKLEDGPGLWQNFFHRAVTWNWRSPSSIFSSATDSDIRKKLLNSVELITDAEYAIQHVQRIDDFENLIKDQGLIIFARQQWNSTP